ncbi:MAG TPA: glycoside hydrolase family 3 N-terminal domain-containing protein [Solirubrobacterales bacterium]|nr:glycoside hydrolase family 3 N-terminal domain-containing protein [Solirubrobacterales bacterium]
MEHSRGPSRQAIARRRTIAVALIAAIAVAAWWAFIRGDGADEAVTVPTAVSPETSEAIAAMTPEQLAEQVLLVGFAGTDPSAGFVEELRSRQLGGVFVRAENWADAASGTALVAALRAAGRGEGRIPPLIVAAQEGGRYRSFGDLPPERTELEIGDGGSIDEAEGWAREAAEALRSAGFDLNLFPVADVATLDSPLGDRAFSDDPATVTELTAAAVRGCAAAGLACAAVHFPGLGAASEDTDRGQATVGLDQETLEARDLGPFATAFSEGMPAVGLSLAFYVAYDPATPAALSARVTTGLLREGLGFEGVAITDDLGAGAVRAGYSAPKAAVSALAAGADLIRIDAPGNQRGVAEAIVAAVESGSLPLARLQQAAARVVELKRTRGLTPM